MSREFEAFCIDHGIQKQHTVRYHPQQNSVAERANRVMEEGVVSMLYDESELSIAFWGEVLATFIHTSTTDPSPQHSQTCTPHEVFHGTKPDRSLYVSCLGLHSFLMC